MQNRREFLINLGAAGAALKPVRDFALVAPGTNPAAAKGPGASPHGETPRVHPGELYHSPKTYFGACYYPEQWEQWDAARLDSDVKLMREASFNITRLAEDAWIRMEPLEGHYDFEWLDHVVEALAKNSVQTVLGTPTTQPPAWLFDKYPDLFSVTAQGQRNTLTRRYLFCMSHPALPEYVRKIVTAMAKRYANNPNVLGWQIDNETGWDTRECHCQEHCQPAFQKWLAARYGTIEKLNSAWGNAFWGMNYTKWSQIPLAPQPIPGDDQPNPGHILDNRRFWSDTVIRFLKFQIDILTEEAPRQFTIHNLAGTMDHFKMARHLNLVGLMSYPGSSTGAGYYDAQSMDTFRGYKDGNYWVVEQQGGRPGSRNEVPEAAPGLLRLWAYQSYAHGADGVIFFRFRTATHGGEEYWHGILNHDGRPNRRFRELAEMGKEMERVGRLLQGTTLVSPVAFYVDYESEGAKKGPDVTRFDDNTGDYYAAFKRQGINIDVTARGRDLTKYQIVVAPMLYMVNEEMVEQFTPFVRAGGTLILTFRSGVKEWDNSVTVQPLPGRLRELAGIEIDEYEPLIKEDPELHDAAIPIEGTGEPFAGRNSTGTIWADIVEAKNARMLAKYAAKFYSGKAAVTLNEAGKGRVIYIATHLSREFSDLLVSWLFRQHAISAPFAVPDGVDLSCRQKDGKKILFVMNFNGTSQQISLPRDYQDVLADRSVSGSVTLRPRDLVILSEV